jgi:hypothetical protein
MIAGPIASRLGPRSLAASDARFKLDRIHQSELVERQGAPGPMCFGPRIMCEPVPYYFQLARGARTYNGSTKPEDWLEDYSKAVNIAGGNLRWVVRYVPQMLEGPARIWLNNLPARISTAGLTSKSSLCQTSPVHTRGRTILSSWLTTGKE